MTFEEFKKASKHDLQSQAQQCFNDLGNALHPREAKLLEAQFYMQEMDRRHDSRIARRDLLLELIVILLIGGEIALGIWGIVIAQREGTNQAELLGKQKTILEHLDTSTAATATTLKSVQSTMEEMKRAEQGQLALFYDVSVSIVHDDVNHQIIISNEGHTNISVWGSQFYADPPIIMPESRIITPGSRLGMPDDVFFKAVKDKIPTGMIASVPFVLYLKNAQQVQFILDAKILFEWVKDTLTMRTITTYIVPKRWDRLVASKTKQGKS